MVLFGVRSGASPLTEGLVVAKLLPLEDEASPRILVIPNFDYEKMYLNSINEKNVELPGVKRIYKKLFLTWCSLYISLPYPRRSHGLTFHQIGPLRHSDFYRARIGVTRKY